MPTPSPRTTCAAPARSPTRSSPTNACSRSSSSCSSTVNSTRSGWPTRPSPGSRRRPRPKRLPDQNSRNSREPEDAMEAAIDRIMQTYDLLANRTSAASAEARAKVTNYLNTLMEAGEKDTHRLTVCGLTYLRELDGTVDPVKAGYTGL